MLDYVMDGTRHANFVTIGSGVSAPQICDFAYTLERIFTQNTPKDVVPCNEVLFGDLNNYI